MIRMETKIKDGRYGVNKKEGDKVSFVPLARAAMVKKIFSSLDDDSIAFELQFEYGDGIRKMIVSRADILDGSKVAEIGGKGLDVTAKLHAKFVDSIRLQEMDPLKWGITYQKSYKNIGWKYLPIRDNNGRMTGKKLCYRGRHLLGDDSAKYIGDVALMTKGSFAAWHDMVLEEVKGHVPLEIVLLSGLSSVVVGLLSEHISIMNPIVHLCGDTSTGKSTAAELCASAFGPIFEGQTREYDDAGVCYDYRSIYGSWSTTEVATIQSCAGNRGGVIILNELGKFNGRDMTSLLYCLSEGSDVLRSDGGLTLHLAEGCASSVISVGEISLLGQCRQKTGGLKMRVLELTDVFTKGAAHADRIKAGCRKNYGFAAEMLAQHILDNGGASYLISVYEAYRQALLKVWPQVKNFERFVSTFPAVMLTTAELFRQALDIDFDFNAIVEYFLSKETQNPENRDTGVSSFLDVVDFCNVNRAFFSTCGCATSTSTCYGRINVLNGGEEILFYKSALVKILNDLGYQNLKTCLDAWYKNGWLDRDKDRATRSRKVLNSDTTAKDVYVLRVMQDSVAEAQKSLIDAFIPADMDFNNIEIVPIPLDDELSQQLESVEIPSPVEDDDLPPPPSDADAPAVKQVTQRPDIAELLSDLED